MKNLFVSGKMNKDADERLIPNGEYKDALNVRLYADNIGAIKNSLGNVQKSDIEVGENAVCIGAIANDKENKIYWFVRSDSGSYILEYAKDINKTKYVLSDTREESVLNLSKAHRITGVNIVIDTENSKTFLYWTDNLNPPRRIEIEEAKSYAVNGFTADDINVIKAPPRKEPTVLGKTSTGISNNLIAEKFFSFAYRYKYNHGEYSALSPFSEFVFEPGAKDVDMSQVTNDAMVNQFNSIDVTFNTGDKNVTDVEVYAKESDKAPLYRVFTYKKDGVGDNTNYTFNFKNDRIFSVLSDNQFERVYDNVPLKAKSQEFVGNRIVYAGYEENYNLGIDPEFLLSKEYATYVDKGLRTLKSDTSYNIGVVYFDRYGRKSPVSSTPDASIEFAFFDNDTANKIKVSMNFRAPEWADRYRFAIKQVANDYYTIRTSGPIYKDLEDGVTYLYIGMRQEELNKVADDGILILKNSGNGNEETKYTYKVVSVLPQQANFLGGGETAGTYVKVTGEESAFTWQVSPAQAVINDYALFESEAEFAAESSYYEIPQTFDIVDRYHYGSEQNQSYTQPSITILNAFNAFTFGDGNESNRIKDEQTSSRLLLGVRVNEELPNYKKNNRIASITYSNVYDESTSYNGLNEFSLASLNYKDMDDRHGLITKLYGKETDLVVFQENKVSRVLVNKSVIYNADGTGNVSQNLNVLGQEIPYLGEYGINRSPESFSEWAGRLYFADDRRSVVCRLSADGMTEVSGYGMNSFFNENLRTDTGYFALGGYDPRNDTYIVSTRQDVIEWLEDEWQCVPGDVTWLEDTYACQE